MRNWNSSLAAGDTCVLLLLLAAAPLLAADDANAIIERLLEAQKANGDRIQPYTFMEEADGRDRNCAPNELSQRLYEQALQADTPISKLQKSGFPPPGP